MRIITKVCPRHINLRQACRQTPKLIEIFKPISIHSFLVPYPHRIHHKTRAPSLREESPLLRSLLVPPKRYHDYWYCAPFVVHCCAALCSFLLRADPGRNGGLVCAISVKELIRFYRKTTATTPDLHRSGPLILAHRVRVNHLNKPPKVAVNLRKSSA